MQSVILVMSLMGSVMLLFSSLSKLFARRLFSAQWEYRLLKICICFFLIPVPLLKNHLYPFYKGIDSMTYISKPSQIIYMDRAIPFAADKQVVLPAALPIIIVVVSVWLIGVFVVLISHLLCYLKMKHYVTLNSVISQNPQLHEQVKQLKKDFRIKRKISILESQFVKSPFTIGLFSILIILPNEAIKEEKMKYILTHELIHVKQFDFFFRILGVLTMALHWFNPFSYMLFREISKLSEHACDEQVVLKLNETQRIIYGNVILDMSSHHIFEKNFRVTLINSFGTNNKKIMKERLKKMKSVKKRKVSSCIMAGAMVLCISMMSFMTVFAYKDSVVLQGFTEYDIDNATIRVPSKEELALSKKLIPKLPSAAVSTYYYDQLGALCIVDEQEENDTKASCSHRYYDDEIFTHIKNSNGGCKESCYNARVCDPCGNIIRGSLISAATYTKCPH